MGNNFENFREKRKASAIENNGDSAPKIGDKEKTSKKKKGTGAAVNLPKNKKDKKIIWAIIGAVIAVISVGVLAWFFVFVPNNNLNLKETVTEEVEQSSTQSGQQSEDFNVDAEEAPEKLFPRPYQPWEAANEEELEDLSLPFAKNAKIDVFMAPTDLPLESAGYTDDPEKMDNEDGSLNVMFTTITEESYLKQLARIVEIFLNPVFGGWENLQYPSDTDYLVEGMIGYPFTEEWLFENASKNAKEVFPIYSDINNDDYGLSGKIREKGPRWIGDLTSGSLEMTFNEETLQYDGLFTGNVKYISYGVNDEKVLETSGVLVLNLVTDNDGKLLVNGAELTVSPVE